MPHCDCVIWRKHLTPCKHIFSMLNHNIIHWDDLPKAYTENVWFVLDPFCFKITPTLMKIIRYKQKRQKQKQIETETDRNGTDRNNSNKQCQSTNIQTEELQSIQNFSISSSQIKKCSESLKSIQSGIYLILDGNILKLVYTKLLE